MIRLEREDFETPEKLESLAAAASSDGKKLTAEEFQKQFSYLVTEIRGGT